jgi:excisionase family DNA binding protein
MTKPRDLGLTKIAYSVDQFAELCGVSRTTAYNAIRAGELRIVKFAGATRILARDVAAYIDGRQTKMSPSRSWPRKNVANGECERLRAGGRS